LTPAGFLPALSLTGQTSTRIAVFAATPWEMRAIRSAFHPVVERTSGGIHALVHVAGEHEYWLVQTGVGPEKARQCAAQLLDHQCFTLLISTGFACALIPVSIGALLVGHEVVYGGREGPVSVSPSDVPGEERDRLVGWLQAIVPAMHVGRFVSTDHVIGSAQEKRAFADKTQAIGLDMESAALAVEANRAHTPFVIIRTVSDLLDEDLPLDFNLFLRPTGWLKGIGSILAAPSCLLGLGRLRRQSVIAAEALTVFFREYAAAMAHHRQERVSAPM
jgi:adenosylhomocysteine nucleosidase